MLAINSSRFQEALTFAEKAYELATQEADLRGLLISHRMLGTSLDHRQSARGSATSRARARSGRRSDAPTDDLWSPG